MKHKILALCVLVTLAISLFIGFAVQRQSVQARSKFTVSIIGGVINSHKTSHITISTIPEARVGMRIFYRCPGVTRTVYANHNANVLGRYTWQWSAGAPCNSGSATVIVVGSTSGQQFVAQKVFLFGVVRKPVPTPTPKPVTGVNGNPWGYNFTLGNYIYNPPAAFCTYFACINNFDNGVGYVNECNDGMYSQSGGIRGDCSYHGGEERPLYSH